VCEFLRGLVDAQLAHPVAQCAGFQTQDGGGTTASLDLPAALVKDADDVIALHGIQAVVGGMWQIHLGQREENVVPDLDDRHARQDGGTLDDVAQFADIARPVVALQRGHRGFGNAAQRLTQPACGLCHEIPGQQRNILAPRTQRRYRDRKHVDPVIQVIPERALRHHAGEITVGRGDDTDIDGQGTAATDPLEGLLLQDTQQLGLRLRGQFADLVEENGAAVREFEATLALHGGAGEGALFMTKQLALDQVLRQRGTVHADERLVAARAARVHRARDQFLAGTGLADQQHTRVGGCDDTHLL